MLNKPKFMSPSVNMYGNSVIDLNSAELPFSCIVDGNEAITAWQIIVSRLDNNTAVFDTGRITLNTPFYPINNRNQNVVFNKNLKDYFSTAEINSGFENGDIPYYWSIAFWGNNNSEMRSAEEVFYANAIPETTIYYSYDNNFYVYDEQSEQNILNDKLKLIKNKNIEKRKIYLKADYNGTALKRYGWRLTDVDTGIVIIDTITQNQIYGTKDNISCECNGLVNQAHYLIELFVETQNGYFGIINSVEFYVNYEVKTLDADFEVTPLNNSSGVLLNWRNIKTTEGVVVGGDVSYLNNYPIVSYDKENNDVSNGSVSIIIPEDTSVVFSENANAKELDIDENSYIVLSFQFDKTNDMILFSSEGKDNLSNYIARELSYNSSDRKFRYKVTKGETVSNIFSDELSDALKEHCWYVVTLYPMDSEHNINLKVVESKAINNMYPKSNLYPKNNLHPKYTQWDKIRKE